jgi:hypothetical protein
MGSYGGGQIEEWVSSKKGDSWQRRRNLTPDTAKYPGWKYNNIQPVTTPVGDVVNGALLFYGWKHRDASEGTAFLLHER